MEMRDQIGIMCVKENSNILNYATSSRQIYVFFKLNLISTGYQFQKETREMIGQEYTSTYYYSNGKYTVELYSFTNENGVLFYCQQIEKN